MIACNLCGSSSHVLLFEHELLSGPLVQCIECGLVCVDISRSRELIQDHQAHEERNEAYAREITIAQGKLHVKLDLEHAERNNKRFNFAGRIKLINNEWARPRESIQLLEVGCGEGLFLEEAKRYGYTVIGVEPNERSSNFARKVLGLNVFTQTLAEAEIDPDSIDIVVSLHVIEHLLDPSGTVSEIRKILRKGGLLAIETPNIDSLPYKILGKKWRQLIPVHYYFFSKKTIVALLEKNGFVVSRIVNVGNRVSVQFFLNRLERLSPKPARLLSMLARWLRLEQRMFYLNPLDLMLVFARKAR
jgi:2-polyprenyl-3-methyl-5-hydroxy-6-metoxy-1,4-benzoquinol methylase